MPELTSVQEYGTELERRLRLKTLPSVLTLLDMARHGSGTGGDHQ